MSNERLCPDGHVVEAGRETCSRCNGPVVNENNDVELGEETNKAMTEDIDNASEAPADEANSEVDANAESSESADSAEANDSSEASAEASDESSEPAAESSDSSESSEE